MLLRRQWHERLNLVMENRAKPELYNIPQDRNEKKNLASEFPKRVLKLKEIHAKTYSRR